MTDRKTLALYDAIMQMAEEDARHRMEQQRIAARMFLGVFIIIATLVLGLWLTWPGGSDG